MWERHIEIFVYIFYNYASHLRLQHAQNDDDDDIPWLCLRKKQQQQQQRIEDYIHGTTIPRQGLLFSSSIRNCFVFVPSFNGKYSNMRLAIQFPAPFSENSNVHTDRVQELLRETEKHPLRILKLYINCVYRKWRSLGDGLEQQTIIPTLIKLKYLKSAVNTLHERSDPLILHVGCILCGWVFVFFVGGHATKWGAWNIYLFFEISSLQLQTITFNNAGLVIIIIH